MPDYIQKERDRTEDRIRKGQEIEACLQQQRLDATNFASAREAFLLKLRAIEEKVTQLKGNCGERVEWATVKGELSILQYFLCPLRIHKDDIDEIGNRIDEMIKISEREIKDQMPDREWINRI